MENVPALFPETVPRRRETPLATTATFMSRKFSFLTCTAMGSGIGTGSALGSVFREQPASTTIATSASSVALRSLCKTFPLVDTSDLPVGYDEPGSRALLFVIGKGHAQVRPAHMTAERNHALIGSQILALQSEGEA